MIYWEFIVIDLWGLFLKWHSAMKSQQPKIVQLTVLYTEYTEYQKTTKMKIIGCLEKQMIKQKTKDKNWNRFRSTYAFHAKVFIERQSSGPISLTAVYALKI